MVYWFVGSLVSAGLQVLLQKLVDFGIEASLNVDDKPGMLRMTLDAARGWVNRAEVNQMCSPEWQSLLQNLDQVIYDADDLLDEISIEAIDGKHKLGDLVGNLFSSRLGRTSTELSILLGNLKDLYQEESHPEVMNKLPTTSLLDVSHVFGREEDVGNLVDMMVAYEATEGDDVHIIPIIGITGVGKTTLAQLVYNYNYQTPFHIKIWISVPREFEVAVLTRSIIGAVSSESNSHNLDLEQLQNRLTAIVRGHKFFLILDDLWNEREEEWDLLLKPLRHGLRGSSIIITTGSQAGSRLVSRTKPYHLDFLSDESCWKMLKRGIDLDASPDLTQIGKKIATKCLGLPSVTKIIRSLLHSHVDEDAWNNILENLIWDLPLIQQEIFPSLVRVYHCLPSHVRPCFAYCSLFPQNYHFEKDKLVQMWMGEGFIIPSPSNQRQLVEDIGSSYFNQLLCKLLFQMNGEKYSLHEVVYNLAQSISGTKYHMKKTDNASIGTNTRHLSLASVRLDTVNVKDFNMCKGLRTFLIHGGTIKDIPLVLFMVLGRLRVLDLSSTQIEDLTKSIGNLKHLRFLDLSNTLLKRLPETIVELCVLQTLRVKNCSKLLCLPKNIGKLKRLRHLELDGNTQLKSMPSGIGEIIGLQTISEFIVGTDIGNIVELKEMNDIRGSLCIKQLENVRNSKEALYANLPEKRYINRLELQWTTVYNSNSSQEALDKLMTRPLRSLKDLTLRRYAGVALAKWLSDPSFTKQLTSIFLYECENCMILPSFGQLPKLKSIKIDGMHGVTIVDRTFFGGTGSCFPSLEILEFCNMRELQRWEEIGTDDMPRLCSLTIINCPKMVSLPSFHIFRSLEKLNLEMCGLLLPPLSVERLSNTVKSLVINECGKLGSSCKKVGGADWGKIYLRGRRIEIDYTIQE